MVVQEQFQQALFLFSQGRIVEAEHLCENILRYKPRYFDALHLLGVILCDTQRSERGVAVLQKALKINRSSALAHNNLGNGLRNLKLFRKAIASYDKAIALKPDYAFAYNNRGNAFKDLGFPEEALKNCDKAILLNPQYSDAYNNRGTALMDLRRPEDALKSYDKAIALNSNYFQAFNNRANALLDLHLPEDALKDYRKAISLNKRYVSGWVGCGNALSILARYADALLAYDDALTLSPNRTDAWVGRGNVLCQLRRYDEAIAAYDKALSIKPDLEGIEGSRLSTKMNLCNWERFDEELNTLTECVRSGKASTDPLVMLRLSDSSEVHLRCARLEIAAKHPQKVRSVVQNTIYEHEKIHVGYVSADLHKHATAYLMAELFELHDEARFSVTAFSLGRDDESDMRRRLVGAFDRFIDCRMLSDYQVASAIAGAEIDILIDLKGFTQDARTNIFAHRPAPVQVNYLGYPGTMGAPYIDYIIGDATLFSAADEPFYTEKLVQLPNSYQPNDRKRQISSKVFTRTEMELPEGSFVFCCFNDNYKILPSTFASWMRILKSVDKSILWLLAETKTAALNLKKEAEICSIDPNRLVFANRLDLPEHLARHQLADLFLDTLPYNAHTTASDALWAGVPVLTQIGNAFAGRVAASLLNAVGLPELITHSAEEYEALAIELALHSEKLKAIRQKLARDRLTTPLFNTPLYTRHLEGAYEAMYQRYQAGLPPDHIVIADRSDAKG